MTARNDDSAIKVGSPFTKSLPTRFMEEGMNLQGPEAVAKALVADGKGILAADETVGTLTKRF
jgi:hypothetical protein